MAQLLPHLTHRVAFSTEICRLENPESIAALQGCAISDIHDYKKNTASLGHVCIIRSRIGTSIVRLLLDLLSETHPTVTSFSSDRLLSLKDRTGIFASRTSSWQLSSERYPCSSSVIISILMISSFSVE